MKYGTMFRLAGIIIVNDDDRREAARRIAAHGASAVLIKGGHFPTPDISDLPVYKRARLGFGRLVMNTSFSNRYKNYLNARSFAGGDDRLRGYPTNYFFGMPGQEEELELTLNHDGRTYDLGTGYGHVAVGVDDLADTLEQLKDQGIEPEREPYRVREGGSLLCFVQDPDGYRIELIDRSGT